MDSTKTEMTLSETDEALNLKDDLDLGNPYSKITCLVLYLYSIELGSPPLYYEINRVSRSKDESHLTTLGPYIISLGLITSMSENEETTSTKFKQVK